MMIFCDEILLFYKGFKSCFCQEMGVVDLKTD